MHSLIHHQTVNTLIEGIKKGVFLLENGVFMYVSPVCDDYPGQRSPNQYSMRLCLAKPLRLCYNTDIFRIRWELSEYTGFLPEAQLVLQHPIRGRF